MENNINCKPLDRCLCCGGSNIKKVLNLGNQPLANSYPASKDAHEDSWPLGISHCVDCTHLQLTHAVNPDLLFRDYLYVSGTTKTLREYFAEFVNIVEDYDGSGHKLKVLDIACNDGSQLDAFKAKDHDTYGIDPAINLWKLSSKNHNVVCDYFTQESVGQLGVKDFDAIIAQNVLAHNSYPKEFLKICKGILGTNGKIFIQTSQADMVRLGQFDTIYHEHISFFNVRSMVNLVEGTGLYLHDVIKTPIHGTSYVFVLTGNPEDCRAEKLISLDWSVDSRAVDDFVSKAHKVVDDLNSTLQKYNDYIKVGYGAAAKGNTLLNFGKIDLDYIVDDNPLKHGLYTPGRKIPILSLDKLMTITGGKNIVWIPLSWNFFDEIASKVKVVQPSKTTFIKYFPEIHVIEK